MSSLLLIAIIFAIGFDIMNGFHDAANSIATVVSTRVLPPIYAVFWAAFFNFVAILIFGPVVAETVSQIINIDPGDAIYVWIILAGLIGAIVWDLVTWWFGLPTSSSHAIIGGLAGAGIAHAGWSALHGRTILIIVEFIVLSPIIGFVCAYLLLLALFWLFRNVRPHFIDRGFRKGQLVSAALYSIGHGANDAQKTMGIIMALLIAAGILAPGTRLSLYHKDTSWIILSCQIAMSLGTFLGGWRIVKTVGMKITKIKPIGGFAAETAGAFTLFLATFAGIPVSTTHTITGAIIGVGAATSSISRIKWGVATRIVWAWVFTIPGAGLIGAIIVYISKLLLGV